MSAMREASLRSFSSWSMVKPKKIWAFFAQMGISSFSFMMAAKFNSRKNELAAMVPESKAFLIRRSQIVSAPDLGMQGGSTLGCASSSKQSRLLPTGYSGLHHPAVFAFRDYMARCTSICLHDSPPDPGCPGRFHPGKGSFSRVEARQQPMQCSKPYCKTTGRRRPRPVKGRCYLMGRYLTPRMFRAKVG